MRIQLAVAWCLLCALGVGAAERPNVVVIYTDDQGYGDASCLNPKSKFRTPNIDRLAEEGITFTDGHCSDTVCTPSRYGLLTGRYAWRTRLKRGVMGAEGECLIAEGRMTLASLFQANGYQTAMVGKWHLGMDFPGELGDRDWTKPTKDMPLDRGFDYYYGIPASMNYGVLAWFEGRFPTTPPTQWTQKKPNKIAISDYRIMPPYADSMKGGNRLEVAPDFVDSEALTRFTDKAIEWLGKADKGKPFFLYLPYTSPHKPVIPIEKFRGRSKAGAYGDFMMETDWHVGRVLDKLDDLGVAKDTIVVLTSDNGPENTWAERKKRFNHASNHVFREGKRSIYEGGHRVPFIVRWPAEVRAGSRWPDPVCQTDLLATFAEVLGVELPDDAGEDSVSFLTEMRLGRGVARPPIVHHAANGRFAIRAGGAKLIMPFGKQKAELYLLRGPDLGEEQDVAASRAALAAGMTSELTAIVKNGRSTPGKKQPNDTGYWADLSWMGGGR